MLSLARKDSENNKVLGRFCLKLPLMPKLIWSCLKRPQKAFATECFRATRNFSTVLTVSGLKTKVIYSFSDKRFNLTEVCKIQACVHLPVARCPLMLCAALCVVHFCRVMLSSYAVMQFLVQAGKHKMPFQAGSTAVALSMCRERAVCGVCASHSLRAAGVVPGWPPKWHWLLWAGSLWSREALFIYSVLHLAVSHRLGPVCCSCDLREWIFLFLLSLECLKQSTCLMF